MKKIGRYEYDDHPINEGQHSVIFSGRDTKTDEKVIIKKLHLIRRANSEAKMLRTVGPHKRIVKLHRLYVRDGQGYIVMEHVEGKTLGQQDELVWTADTMSVESACRIAIRICQTLNFMRKKGVYHNDIKPTNIIVSPTHPLRIKIIDFSSATKPAFPAPYDRDVYSTAVIIALLMTGKVSFTKIRKPKKKRLPVIAWDQITHRPLRKILKKALHPNEARRYKRPRDLIHDLKKII